MRNVLMISAAIALSALAGGCGLDYLDPFYAMDHAAKAKSDANMRADHEARQKAYQQEVDKERNRRQSYVDSHPELTEQQRADILSGAIRIGMSQEAAIASWGEPDHRSKTVMQYGVHEQWMYTTIHAVYATYTTDLPWAYVYFENGKLTSWQTEQ